jgi:hypothetical protein
MKPNNNHFPKLPSNHIVFIVKPNNNHFLKLSSNQILFTFLNNLIVAARRPGVGRRVATEVPDIERSGGGGGDRRRVQRRKERR